MSRAYICNGWYIGYEGQLMSIHIILYFLKKVPTFSSNTATMVHLPREDITGTETKPIFQLLTSQSCFISDPFLFYESVNRHCYFSKLH